MKVIAIAKKDFRIGTGGSALSLPRKSFALGTDGGSPIVLPPFVPYAPTSAVPSSASCYLETFFGRCSMASVKVGNSTPPWFQCACYFAESLTGKPSTSPIVAQALPQKV